MAIRFLGVLRPRRTVSSDVNRAASRCLDVPKGYMALYVGESDMKRFIVPVSFLNKPLFQDLLSNAEEEFGYYQPIGGLTIPCTEDIFIDVTFSLCRS